MIRRARRVLVLGALVLGVAGLAGSSAFAAGEEIVVETSQFNPAVPQQWIDYSVATTQAAWLLNAATCLKLLDYDEETGALEPEAATAMPTVSADGKTYTFTVRDDFVLSPPSNERVTAETFKFVIDRNLNPELQSPAGSFVSDIVGAQAVLDGKAKSASGVTVDGNKLTIRLTKPAPDFMSRIAMWFFCAIPRDTPVDPQKEKPVPTAGPYYVASWEPNRRLIVKRNPNYKGERPANVDEIRYTASVEQTTSVLQIQNGEVDYAADGIPPTQNCELGRKFGPDSQAAKDGKQQFFVNPALTFQYLGLNTQRPTFADPDVRKAVAYAIDRKGLLALSGCFAGEPTDQYLPFNLPAFKDADIYPLDEPDIEKARELMGGKTGKAVMYTFNQSPGPERAQLVQANLERIGIDVTIRQFPRQVQFTKQATRGEPFDIADEGWIADYPDPYDFINKLLDGRTILPSNNVNISYFNDPKYNRKMDAAQAKTGDERNEAYAALDEDIARNAAPLVAWSVMNWIDFVSARVGCYLYHPVYTMDLAALCIRK